MIIKNDKEHAAVMLVIDLLMDAKINSDDETALSVLTDAVVDYEDKKYPELK